MKKILLVAAAALAILPFFASAADALVVKAIDGNKAKLIGNAQGLKSGDYLYFSRSPFRFTISEVKGNEITIDLPNGSAPPVNSSLLRAPDESIKKNMQMEQKLKHAIED
jgi:hypothetical protein